MMGISGVSISRLIAEFFVVVFVTQIALHLLRRRNRQEPGKQIIGKADGAAADSSKSGGSVKKNRPKEKRAPVQEKPTSVARTKTEDTLSCTLTGHVIVPEDMQQLQQVIRDTLSRLQDMQRFPKTEAIPSHSEDSQALKQAKRVLEDLLRGEVAHTDMHSNHEKRQKSVALQTATCQTNTDTSATQLNSINHDLSDAKRNENLSSSQHGTDGESQLLQELAFWAAKAAKADQRANEASAAAAAAMQQMTVLEEALATYQDQQSTLQFALTSTKQEAEALSRQLATALQTTKSATLQVLRILQPHHSGVKSTVLRRRKFSRQMHAATYKEALVHSPVSPSSISPADHGIRSGASVDWEAATPSPKNASSHHAHYKQGLHGGLITPPGALVSQGPTSPERAIHSTPQQAVYSTQQSSSFGTGSACSPPLAYAAHGKLKSVGYATCPVPGKMAQSCSRRLSLGSRCDAESPSRHSSLHVIRKVGTPKSASKALDAQLRRRRALRLLQQWKNVLHGDTQF